MNDDEWLNGSDDWISEEKTRSLSIPGIALPGLRDLKILFVALIHFDLFLGPVVYLNELSRGSVYIAKLRNHHIISDLYAGLASSDVKEQTTLEESIAIFRYYHKDGEDADTITVMLISCIAGADLEPVKELGSHTLFKSVGNPEVVGKEFSKYLRSKLSSVKKFKSASTTDKIVILDDNRIAKPLDYERIKGILILDYSSKLADFRIFPSWISGTEINELEFINYIDQLSSSIDENSITSLIYRDNILLATKFNQEKTYVIILIEEDDIIKLQKVSDWFIPYARQVSTQWKLSSPKEIMLSLEFLDAAIFRGTLIEDLERYVNMILRASKLKPNLNHHLDLSSVQSTVIDDQIWNKLINLDGTLSIMELSIQWKISFLELIPILEWTRLRDIIIYFDD